MNAREIAAIVARGGGMTNRDLCIAAYGTPEPPDKRAHVKAMQQCFERGMIRLGPGCLYEVRAILPEKDHPDER
jgi:hypothetical protein